MHSRRVRHDCIRSGPKTRTRNASSPGPEMGSTTLSTGHRLVEPPAESNRRPHPDHSCCRTPLVKGAEVRGSGVSVVDRGEPVASCSEWHGDGTAGEDDRGSVLLATVPGLGNG